MHTHSDLISFCWNSFSTFQLLNDICFVFKRRPYFSDRYPVSLKDALSCSVYPLVQRDIDIFYNLLSAFNTFLHTSLYLRETSVNGLVKYENFRDSLK